MRWLLAVKLAIDGEVAWLFTRSTGVPRSVPSTRNCTVPSSPLLLRFASNTVAVNVMDVPRLGFAGFTFT